MCAWLTLGPGGSSSEEDPRTQGAGRRSVRAILEQSAGGGERYEVAGEIARGGMGVVLRAVDCDIRREVAVKYLLDQVDPGKKARFVEEAQITGQLEHPNIVPVHEIGVDAQHRLFFSMKMVRGRSLGQVLAEVRDDPRAAEKEYTLTRLLNVFVNVCHALAYAHSRGVVHRDLKPANIMVGDFGEVYVMDWGLAKVLPRAVPVSKPAEVISSAPSFAWTDEGGASSATAVNTSRESADDRTLEGTILGTPLYMPPEQARGDLMAIDPRSDVYALGAILYEMLTLQPPVERGGGHAAVLKRVIAGEILAPEQRNPARARAGKIPRELAAVAMKALEKDPAQRYPTAEALRGDIERFLEGRSVSAKEDARWEVVWKFAKRNKGFSAATAAASVLLAVVLVWSSVVNYKARVRAEQAYAAYLKEQDEKRAQTRKSVPAFVEAARLAIGRRKFDDALAQVNAALDYDPDHAGARLLKGQLLAARKDFATARPEFEAYLKLRPGDAEAKKLARLCGSPRPDDPGFDAEVGVILQRQDMLILAEGLFSDPEKLVEIHRRKIEKAWPGLGERLTKEPNGNLLLNLSDCPQVFDLTPLQGMPLRALQLFHSKVRDLTPLRGMKLTRLELFGSQQITDLSPLKGMELTHLDVAGCPVEDYSPLKGMPLTILHVNQLRDGDLKLFRDMPLTELASQFCGQLTDLRTLRGMKLTFLSLQHCLQLKELSPLRGLPLTHLSLVNAPALNDLTPLRDMPLTDLTLQSCPALQDLTPLAGMRLTRLNLYGSAALTDLTPLKTMPLVFLNLHACGQVGDLSPLRGMPLTWLDLGDGPRVSELGILRGMRLTLLDVSSCEKITDWSPLQGMPLTQLTLSGCTQVTDLTPFRGLPLTTLWMGGCSKVTDLAPLRDMPLANLDVSNCGVQDLTPLEGMKLVHVAFTPASVKKGVDVLRRMKTLTLINSMSPAEFWKKYDAGEFTK